MPYPILEKTWQHDVGRNIGTTYRGAMIGIKNALKAFPLNPMVVRGSSNGVTAGMDGVDRWGAAGDLVGNTSGSGTRSWLVLRTAAGSELLLDAVNIYGSGDVPHWSIVFSGLGAFTGGAINARPTAPDESAAWTNEWYAFDASGNGTYLQLLHSTDGRETRMVITASTGIHGGYRNSWCVGELADSPSGWPAVKYWMIDGFFPSNTSLYSVQTDERGVMVGLPPTGYPGRRARLSLEGRGDTAPPMGVHNRVVPNSFSAKWPMATMRLVYRGNPTDGPITLLGRIKDTWAGSPAHVSGTGYLDGAVRKFAQFGYLIVPWNNSTVVVS